METSKNTVNNSYNSASLEDIAKSPSGFLGTKLEVIGKIISLAEKDKKTIEFTLESLNGLPNIPEKIKAIAEYTHARYARMNEWTAKKKIIVADGRLHTKLYQVTTDDTATVVLSEAGQEDGVRIFKEVPTADTIDKYNFLTASIREKRN
jgi:hypothetical protein